MSKLKEMETALVRVDEMAAEKRELFVQARTGLQQALCAATAIYELKEALTHEMMRPVMALQGSNLGFLTDKIYPEQAIREVIIEASLRGVPIYGNCFNVIGGRLYVTKQGFRYLLAQVAGLTDLALSFGSVNIQNGQAEISCKASWNLNGKPDALSKTIPVRVNSGMGADGALGKAERKLLRDVYERVSGAQLNEGEAPEVTAEKQSFGRVVDEGKLQASAAVSESGNVPEFLKSKPAPVEQEVPTDEDRAAMERINAAPAKAIRKPAGPAVNKLPALAVVAEGEMPDFLKSQPAQGGAIQERVNAAPASELTTPECPSDDDRTIQERVNAAPAKPAHRPSSKPKGTRAEVHVVDGVKADFANKLGSCQISYALANAALSRLMRLEGVSWEAMSDKQLAYTLDAGWDKFANAVHEIADEQE